MTLEAKAEPEDTTAAEAAEVTAEAGATTSETAAAAEATVVGRKRATAKVTAGMTAEAVALETAKMIVAMVRAMATGSGEKVAMTEAALRARLEIPNAVAMAEAR